MRRRHDGAARWELLLAWRAAAWCATNGPTPRIGAAADSGGDLPSRRDRLRGQEAPGQSGCGAPEETCGSIAMREASGTGFRIVGHERVGRSKADAMGYTREDLLDHIQSQSTPEFTQEGRSFAILAGSWRLGVE